MVWSIKDSGHQQPWYWPDILGINQSQPQRLTDILDCLSCNIIYCRFHIHISWESWVLFLLLLRSLMLCANNGVHYGSMVVFVWLHITLHNYHQYADVSEGIELNACKVLIRYILTMDVSKIKSVLSIIFYAIYEAKYSAYPFLLWWLWDYVYFILLIIKSEVWLICHCLGLVHEAMLCDVCLSIFLYTFLK